MASIDKRPDGRYRARWREYPGGPQRTRQFDRKSEATAFLDRLRGDLARGVYVDPSEGRRLRLEEYAGQWIAAQPWRPSTQERVRSTLRVHVLPAFGRRPLGGLRTSELQAWARGLEERLAPATVEAVVRTLRSLLNAAVADGVLARSPADGIKLRRREGTMLVPLSVAEVRSLADAVVPELRAAVVLAGVTGLRQGELFGITVDRVGFLQRELVVDRQLVTPAKGDPVLGPTKTARSVRTVPVPDHALAELAAHLERYGPGEGGLLFHRDGGPWRRNRAADAFRAASTSAEVPAVGWHALRHHAASVLIAQGLSVTAVAAVLGHSPEECLRTYAGWWPDAHEAIRSAMARAWAEPEDAGKTRGLRTF